MKKEQILDLIGQYWDLAHAEGAEHRGHDTEDCAAQRVLSSIAAALDEVFADASRLRAIVSECAAAIGNGAFCSPHASVEFMESVPKEIAIERAKVVDALAPIRLVYNCIVNERGRFTNEAFIVFESSLDERVRLTFGDIERIIEAFIPHQRPVAA